MIQVKRGYLGQTDVKLKFRWVQRCYGQVRHYAFRAHSPDALKVESIAALAHLRPELGISVQLQAIRDVRMERFGWTVRWEPLGPTTWHSDPARIEEQMAILAPELFELAIKYQS